jgi:hypothetical protein
LLETIVSREVNYSVVLGSFFRCWFFRYDTPIE